MLRKCLIALPLIWIISGVAQAATQNSGRLASGMISGTVTDVNGDLVPGAIVKLECPVPCEGETSTADENATFSFYDLQLGVPYQIRVSALNFEDWTSPAIDLTPDQSDHLVTGINLRMQDTAASVTVYASTAEIVAEQIHFEEQQRVLGFIPNVYVVYDSQNAAPLTAKLKFQLAMKVTVDPITLASVAFMAGTRQLAHTPNYQLGAKGYGQRVGAEAADGFSDILIGGAILPSLLHQDPRYFYQGTGTTRSRLGHAFASPFVCKGDNGKWQLNYSSVGGDLAASALMVAYYPQSNRGAGMVFGQFAVSTAERELNATMQEFVLRRLTSSAHDRK
jgi:hypothetical protein